MALTKRSMASVYLLKDDQILLLYRQGSRVVNNVWIGSAGGHMEPQEMDTPETCALRELHEELRLTEDDITPPVLRYITLRLKNGEVRQNYYFFARLREDKALTSTEGQLHWVKFEDIPQLKMPSSAKHMILHYLKEGRYTDCLYAGITEENGTKFIPLIEFEG